MKYLVISVLAILLAGCGVVSGQSPALPSLQQGTPAEMTAQAQHGAAMTQAQVSLEIFSGRPSPTWTLSEDSTHTLLSMISELPDTDQAMPEGPLGYRGFIVTVPQSTATPTSTFTVYRNLIKYDNNGTPMLLDANRHVEQFLITSAKDHLDPEVYAALVSQAEGS